MSKARVHVAVEPALHVSGHRREQAVERTGERQIEVAFAFQQQARRPQPLLELGNAVVPKTTVPMFDTEPCYTNTVRL